MFRKISTNLLATITIFLIVSINVYFQFRTGIDSPKFGDSGHYLAAAQAIYNSEEYPRLTQGWPFFRAPGYPYLISTIWQITAYDSILALKIFNSICMGLLALGIYLLARRIMSQNFAIIGAVLGTLNPFVFSQSLEVSTETTTAVIFIYFIYFLTNSEFKTKGLLLGILITGLTLIRPEYLFILVASLVFYYSFTSFNLRKLIIPILFVALSLNFWGLANKKATGSYMPLTNATSFHLWFGSSEFVYNNYPLEFQDTTKFSKKQFNHMVSEMEVVKDKYAFQTTISDIPRQSEAWFNEFRLNVEKDKLNYVKNLFVKAAIFWRPFLNPSAYGPNLVWASFVILIPLMLFSSIGYIHAIRSRIFRGEVIAITNCLIVLTIIHALQIPDFRYRVPVQLPVLALFTAYFLSIATRSTVAKITSKWISKK
jgi:hypothetical protein